MKIYENQVHLKIRNEITFCQSMAQLGQPLTTRQDSIYNSLSMRLMAQIRYPLTICQDTKYNHDSGMPTIP